MAYGLQVENENGKLVLSDGGLLPGYIGRATLLSVQQAAPAFGAPGYNGLTGMSLHQIVSAGPIIPAIRLEVGRHSSILSMSRSGSLWTIAAYHGGTPIDGQGFEYQYAPEVHVWAIPTSVSGYGMALYNPSGALAGDLSKRPLDYKQKVRLTSVQPTVALDPTIVTPAIIGDLHDWRRQRSGSGPFYTYDYDTTAWTLTAGPELLRAYVRSRHMENEDSIGASVTLFRDVRALLVDVNGY